MNPMSIKNDGTAISIGNFLVKIRIKRNVHNTSVFSNTHWHCCSLSHGRNSAAKLGNELICDVNPVLIKYCGMWTPIGKIIIELQETGTVNQTSMFINTLWYYFGSSPQQNVILNIEN